MTGRDRRRRTKAKSSRGSSLLRVEIGGTGEVFPPCVAIDANRDGEAGASSLFLRVNRGTRKGFRRQRGGGGSYRLHRVETEGPFGRRWLDWQKGGFGGAFQRSSKGMAEARLPPSLKTISSRGESENDVPSQIRPKRRRNCKITVS